MKMSDRMIRALTDDEARRFGIARESEERLARGETPNEWRVDPESCAWVPVYDDPPAGLADRALERIDQEGGR